MADEDAGEADGRRARGRRRRAEIIEATLAVVQRDGTAGVTHRTVAREAGIPTSLSTYYFATLDDLLVAALTSVADVYTARIRRIADGPGDRLRGLAERACGPGRSGLRFARGVLRYGREPAAGARTSPPSVPPSPTTCGRSTRWSPPPTACAPRS